MAKATRAAGYRRKNRRLELTVNIPEDYANDEEFLNSLADKMDDTFWQLQLDEDTDDDGDTTVTVVKVNKIKLGEVEFEHSAEEED